jgi:hypothetical protein
VARNQYIQESKKLVEGLNQQLAPGQLLLIYPDEKFNRKIGEHTGKPYSVTGELLSQEAYARHVQETLPNDESERFLKEIFKEKDWIAPVGDRAGAMAAAH